MKLLIAGSRSIVEYRCSTMGHFGGCARGADQLGAARNGILVRRFPADWDRFGKAAGVYRNGSILWDDSLGKCWDC